MFKATHPILGTRDILPAIGFYTQRLGFKLAFGDNTDPPNYVGFRRDAGELHMQFQFEHEMGSIRLRFLVEDPDCSSMNFGNAVSSALPTKCKIPLGERANSPSMRRAQKRSVRSAMPPKLAFVQQVVGLASCRVGCASSEEGNAIAPRCSARGPGVKT
jgi:hypothetical protein